MAKQVMNEFYCTSCGNRGIPISRISGKERKAGHLKKIFCLKCQKETNHAECQPFSKYTYHNFLEEYIGGNFTEEGSRIIDYGYFKDKAIKEHRWNKIQEKIEEIEVSNK